MNPWDSVAGDGRLLSPEWYMRGRGPLCGTFHAYLESTTEVID